MKVDSQAPVSEKSDESSKSKKPIKPFRKVKGKRGRKPKVSQGRRDGGGVHISALTIYLYSFGVSIYTPHKMLGTFGFWVKLYHESRAFK